MPFVDRATFIELLEKLRQDDDAEVLAAAREITKRMDEGGVAWDQILVDPDAEDADDDFDEDLDDEPLGEAADDSALIESLLAREDLSDEMREELEGYKDDIAEGEFTASDSRYLNALAKRLTN